MHAYVLVPASLEVTIPFTVASFISHCGGGGLSSSGLVGTRAPGQPVCILTNTQASDMVAQGATTTAAGKSKKSTTKHNFDKLNLRHFKRYREWYINMTNLISADRTQLKDLENGLITLAEFTAQHHDCDPENPFDMEEILKLYNENDADNYRILVTTRLHRNLDVGATARDMCKHTG